MLLTHYLQLGVMFHCVHVSDHLQTVILCCGFFVVCIHEVSLMPVHCATLTPHS